MDRRRLVKAFSGLAGLLLFASTLAAGEKKLMHCFAFTPIDTAAEADWKAFYDATDKIPAQIPGVSKVWYGKLLRPLAIFQTDREAQKKLVAGEAKVTGEVTRRVRAHGVCMEMANETALKTYSEHPYHVKWDEAYSKVRQPGTTTFDIIGQ